MRRKYVGCADAIQRISRGGGRNGSQLLGGLASSKFEAAAGGGPPRYLKRWKGLAGLVFFLPHRRPGEQGPSLQRLRTSALRRGHSRPLRKLPGKRRGRGGSANGLWRARQGGRRGGGQLFPARKRRGPPGAAAQHTGSLRRLQGAGGARAASAPAPGRPSEAEATCKTAVWAARKEGGGQGRQGAGNSPGKTRGETARQSNQIHSSSCLMVTAETVVELERTGLLVTLRKSNLGP